MNLHALHPGTYRVCHPQRATPFLLSVVNMAGLLGVRGYELGTPPPARSTHYLLNDCVCNWLSELHEIKGGSK